ncbi:hypothetical protein A1OE_971 [Candidatus Endolissoclinum faulkneri L2]|uniref:DUF2062 domain-containing protein n=1 Tax=Candidatus Endolissoclinum faulkneri L2 TaxID=1193729 RepID=K7YNN4_9PROT|nr:hypothetical protein A1OE_971 [Candidatus Endolissoclinum faulkneri L2]
MQIKIISKILRQWKKTSMSPGVISRSMSMGMVIGFSPTVGLQAIICFLTAFICNRLWRQDTFDWIIALVGSLVVNPLTLVPTYTFYYWVGCHMITCSNVMDVQDFENIKYFLYALKEGTAAIFLGSVPFMIIGLPLGYYIGKIVERLLKNRIQSRQARMLKQALNNKTSKLNKNKIPRTVKEE